MTSLPLPPLNVPPSLRDRTVRATARARAGRWVIHLPDLALGAYCAAELIATLRLVQLLP